MSIILRPNKAQGNMLDLSVSLNISRRHVESSEIPGPVQKEKNYLFLVLECQMYLNIYYSI